MCRADHLNRWRSLNLFANRISNSEGQHFGDCFRVKTRMMNFVELRNVELKAPRGLDESARKGNGRKMKMKRLHPPRLGPLIVLAFSALLMLFESVSSAPAHAQHHAHTTADQCDWTGSDGGGKGVRPVYLRCSRGTVSWHYPRGALRVVLSGGEGFRNFRGCVKVSGPARVYLEGKSSLRAIYAPNDGKHKALHRCFRSRGTIAALYVEADEPSPGKAEVKLQYDLEKQDPDEEAECRPCSKEELAKAFCQSDLVARGTVSAVENRRELESSELVLRVTKMLRRVEENEDNEVDTDEPWRQKEVRVRVSTACDARHGSGEFVIMAKKRLGDLTLVCAPRLEAWAEAVRTLESAPCVLRS